MGVNKTGEPILERWTFNKGKGPKRRGGMGPKVGLANTQTKNSDYQGDEVRTRIISGRLLWCKEKKKI